MSLAPEDHVRVQAAVQRWTDSAISKTCNAPADYTVEQTKQLYTLMYDLGCKGGTIYRDGSRDEQILAVDSKNLGKDAHEQVSAKAAADEKLSATKTSEDKSIMSALVKEDKVKEVMSVSGGNVQIKIAPRQRPDVMMGITYKIATPYGNLYVTINEDSHGAFEVFAQMGKAGGFFSAQTEAITRLISLSLRSNIAIEEIIDQLKGIRGPDVSFSQEGMVFSLPDAIAKILDKHIKRGQQQLTLPMSNPVNDPSQKIQQVEEVQEKVVETLSQKQISTNGGTITQKTQRISIANLGNAPVCPTCANMMVFAEGCMKCEHCGYSKCG
jgi:ribonucleoside-diphosphate reductase alpha chain